MPTDKEIAALVEALAEALVKGTPLDLSYAEATEAAEMAVAALTTPSDRASGQGDGWQSIELLDRGADDQKQVIAARFENGKMTMQARTAWPWEASWATHFIPMPAPPSNVVPGEQERGHV